MVDEKRKTYVYLRETLYKSYGVRVIVDQIVQRVKDVEIVFSLTEIPDNSIAIPYGILEANQVLSTNNFQHKLSLFIDGYSLGVWSTFKQLLFKPYIPVEYKVQCLLRYIKFLYLEYKVFKSFDRIMLVSWGDKKYYESLWLTKKYAYKIFVIPNGVVLPDKIQRRRTRSKHFIVGCLSAWNTHTIYPFYMFLNDVWSKCAFVEDMELVVAGRGLPDDAKKYIQQYPKVRIIGEVDKLDEFYNQIDASLVVMIKKCGIINRMLDGFSYQVPVICRPENLLAFKELPDCCYSYTDVNSFTEAIRSIKYNPATTETKVQLAYEYIKENNNWEKNYCKIGTLL